MKRATAIQALIGGLITVDNKGNVTSDDGRTLPSDAEVDAKLAELIAEEKANEYKEVREMKYPEIGDQLDDLYHAGVFSADMTAKLKKVKDDNPK